MSNGSRRTYDSDLLIIRKVSAFSPADNSAIPAQRVLTADGAGGTYWAIPSSLGVLPSFNRINVDGDLVTADLSYNTLTITSGDGIGIDTNSTTKELILFSKTFSQFDVSGGNSLVAYSNLTVTPTVTIVGTNGISISSDPLTNTLYFNGTPGAISTGIYGYSQFDVIFNASTLTADSINNSNHSVLTATSPSTMMRFVGVGDILLSTNVTSNIVFISVSSFNSQQWASIIQTVYSTPTQIYSTISSLYYDNTEVGKATSSIMNSLSNVSVGIQSQILYDEQNVQNNYLQKNDFYALSTAIGPLVNSNAGIYISSSALTSTVVGLGSAGYISTASGSSGVAPSSLTSTVQGLGLVGYISTAQLLSTVGGLQSNISSFIDPTELTSTIVGLATGPFISSSGMASTVAGLGSIGYISSASLVSSVRGLGLVGYVSTPSLVSTVAGLGSLGYQSTATNVTSSLQGLGTLGYLSSVGVTNSSLQGLGTLGYTSSVTLYSTVAGLGTVGYTSTASLNLALVSSHIGLGSSGYISSVGVTNSSLQGLGTLGYLSTVGVTNSSLQGLGTLGYASSLALYSTVAGLGSLGYQSTATNVTSSLQGLGTLGYLSTVGVTNSSL